MLSGVEMGVLHFPAQSLSGQWTQSIQSRALPAPVLAMGPSAEQLPYYLEPGTYSACTELRATKQGEVKVHPSRPRLIHYLLQEVSLDLPSWK